MQVKINTLAIEFTFDFKGSGTKKVNFYRGLYGHRSFSNYGKYIYIKDGLLSNIMYLKPTRSTIILSVKNAKEVRKFFKQNKVDFDEKIVILNKKEAKELGLKFDSNWDRVYSEILGNENLRFSIDF